MKGKNKHSTRIERRNKNLKKKKQKRGWYKNNWDISKHSKVWIIGMPEGEEEEQEIENLFEKIMKENFPNLLKKIDFQKVQET